MFNAQSHLAIPVRYNRSINIERDFKDDQVGVHDYQVTPLVLQTAERIINGLAPQSTTRAFSVIGPYGSGKSAFGVFIAHFLQSDQLQRQVLLAEQQIDASLVELLIAAPRLLPVLVGGNNASLRSAVLTGLKNTFASHTKLADKRLRLPHEIDESIEDPDIASETIAEIFADACDLVNKRTEYAGLVLVIDELGQFLDFAARQSDERELFVLQTLAEMAARSNNNPFVILTILHQAFDRYVGNAGAARRTEWSKVQGRFTDLPFQEPSVQMLRMVGRALCADLNDIYATTRQAWAENMLDSTIQLGLKPVDINLDEWKLLLARTYPLHPSVLIALPLLFRQLAQNERSLFAFLTAPEPWSIQDFLQTTQPSIENPQLPIYRLPQLYAYIYSTLGASLFGRARGQRWAELAEALAQLSDQNPLLVDVLTTIGTLGALGQTHGLKASRKQILFALQGLYTEEQVDQALNELTTRKHITYRQHRESFVIWEGSDLALDEMIASARREIGENLVQLLQNYANVTPLVARRHSYLTGAVRFFIPRFIDPSGLSDLAITNNADGEILYIVPADQEALEQARIWTEHPDRSHESQRIVVLPYRVRELSDLLFDVAALSHVLEHRNELDNDRAARREISSRLSEAQDLLSGTIAEAYSPQLSRWFWCGIEHPMQTAREVDQLLSHACDQTYPLTPHIWNELIVRRQLSASASKARRLLIEAMLNQRYVEKLGIEGYPPERSIYESVLRQSGIHRQNEQGFWEFSTPAADDPLKLQPTWDLISRYIDQAEGRELPLIDLYQQLEAPPFGVKQGLIPLLFMAVYLARAGEIVLYEQGNYVVSPDMAMFERLLRQPHYFSLRSSRRTGLRQAVYERLATALAPKALTKVVQPAVLDAITPLLRLVHTLPQYTRTTKNVSPIAQSIRQALLDARAPDQLLFEKLPIACGYPAFDPDQSNDNMFIEPFFTTLREGLQELQATYQQLVNHVVEKIRVAFSATNLDSELLHTELINRYQLIAELTKDTTIRAFGVRIENSIKGASHWIESIAALVGRKPLDTWSDHDLTEFETQIAVLGRSFKLVEQMAITTQSLPSDTPVLRVGIANGHGEVSTVIHLNQRHPLMDELFNELTAVMDRYDRLTIEQKTAILTELLQPNLAYAMNGNEKL